ncbi:sucrose phosphorylase [Rheinheimera baltica]|uniref:sucrose phosphorylase n=1 Tax=Rheinheimera baltica TaxID=67576 RepID=UPI00273E77D6|nr:sucrose phosphorylase [Rheinheimera baltica]MDP5142749.1 sucrose phosphorylase [Rheinheimera baltica]MDP5149576.1 sucrose phosphorylase [Rheinheimera baltica]
MNSKNHTNQIQLITYIDRLSGGKINNLHQMLQGPLAGLFDGVHLLPFYPPIDGEDAGFDPTDHTAVDSRLGNWDDIRTLAADFPVMADMIVNHMSAQSPQFLDVLEHGEKSPYWPLFLTKDTVFGEGATAEQISAVYRPRPTPFFTDIALKDGRKVPFWTTFTANQIDIDVNSAAGKAYLNAILERFTENGVKYIRLDAAGYAIKKAGTRCFMLPETFEFIAALSERAKARGMVCLVEIHGYHQTQIEIAKRCDMVYDFALPPLVLHTLFSRNAEALKHWLDIAPRNCITVLDTHDGIGIVDAADYQGQPGLLTDPELDTLVETIHKNSKGSSKLATGSAANNVDLYQVNCSFYDALGQNDQQYLLARAIQLFCPGISQIYYAGLLAMENDVELLQKSRVGRDIGRPYLTADKVENALQKPVVKALCQLIKLRRSLQAFNGKFSQTLNNDQYQLCWQHEAHTASLEISLASLQATIHWQHGGQQAESLSLNSL